MGSVHNHHTVHITQGRTSVGLSVEVAIISLHCYNKSLLMVLLSRTTLRLSRKTLKCLSVMLSLLRSKKLNVELLSRFQELQREYFTTQVLLALRKGFLLDPEGSTDLLVLSSPLHLALEVSIILKGTLEYCICVWM